uniref:Uncharacterized protein n=2 Tax=Physcomitrium patens TaxID=3218 RepID=A0A2K1J1Q3_PHYPA|nr:hypothetical protein PHYPA_023347 [Physcomitrium patens]
MLRIKNPNCNTSPSCVTPKPLSKISIFFSNFTGFFPSSLCEVDILSATLPCQAKSDQKSQTIQTFFYYTCNLSIWCNFFGKKKILGQAEGIYFSYASCGQQKLRDGIG